MSRRESLRGTLRAVPVDVVLVLVALFAVHLAVLLAPGHPLRIAVTVSALLVLPGYALTTAVFPAVRPRDESPDSRLGVFGGPDDRPAALRDVERAALSLGLSVALMPLFGLLLQVAVGGFALTASLWLVTGFVVLALVVGLVRRARTPAEVRYAFPVDRILRASDAAFGRAGGRNAALNVTLALTVVLSMSTLGYALVAPQDGSQFTEAYLLAQQDDGQFASKNYPTAFGVGESRPLMLVVTNHEGESVTYTAVVELQRRADDGSVTDRVELDRFSQQLADGETWRNQHEVAPTLKGERLHLVYLVYRGTPPADPSEGTAYRSVSLQVDVGTASASASEA